MRPAKWLTRILFVVAVIVAIDFSARNSPAVLHSDGLTMRVEIDGVDYGTLDNVDGFDLGDIVSSDSLTTQPSTITLQRHFVTDPSLYLWAKNNVDMHQGLKDVHLVKQNSEGREVARYALKYCQPLSWTVEVSNPSLGGFHESIDIAVQQITAR